MIRTMNPAFGRTRPVHFTPPQPLRQLVVRHPIANNAFLSAMPLPIAVQSFQSAVSKADCPTGVGDRTDLSDPLDIRARVVRRSRTNSRRARDCWGCPNSPTAILRSRMTGLRLSSHKGQAPSTNARRAWLLPVLVMPPRRTVSPLDRSPGSDRNRP